MILTIFAVSDAFALILTDFPRRVSIWRARCSLETIAFRRFSLKTDIWVQYSHTDAFI